MADGYARAIRWARRLLRHRRAPACFNMVTALAAAGADRTPVLAISGEVPDLGRAWAAFQDASRRAASTTLACCGR